MIIGTGRDDAAGRGGIGPDLRALLRQATSEAHRRLDTGWAGHDFGERGAYGAFLVAMAAALVPLEADLALAEPGALPPDWPARRRSGALLADLAALGHSGPPAPAPPRAPTRPEAAGLLYVLEGSRLGGQLLLRQALASSDPAVRDNTRFLRHGEGQRLWPSFAAWLADRPPSDADGAATGALRAFALFETAQGTGI
ncbi:biliverdin-producing heme oxygenase [Methylobacterium sp. J-090]|uniref:biliverdin-producing heme oxygenase n=1 Tax=Methylobacterium sp. J-090 TaxID=2836666 RepID=UPI001FB94F38|nr:biliverdin-producing heme oxygenase [Methylobacterium sp. J-090]MCJ2081630.1 biliverdin-producing heme oxygenase [Methylobacterium sp. J-090]